MLSTTADPARRGAFIGDSLNNGDPSGGPTNINTNNKAWGIYSNTGFEISIERNFPPMSKNGDSISFLVII